MTKEEILKMEPGEELDKLVAIEVMGETIPEFTPENALDLQLAGSPVKSPKGNWLCLCKYEEGDVPIWRPLPFSTDISAAWQVVEKMEELGCSFILRTYDAFTLRTYNAHRFQAEFDNHKHSTFFGIGTPPEAICKAALLAKLEAG